MTSPDGYFPPPYFNGPSCTDGNGDVFCIDGQLRVCRNGTPTNGHGIALQIFAGQLFVKSPNAQAHWWRGVGTATAGGMQWTDLGTTTDPSGKMPPITMFQSYVWDGTAWTMT